MLRAVSLKACLGPGLRVVVCLAIGGGCVGIAQAANGAPRPGVGGVRLGMTPEQVINKLGKPALMDCGVSSSGKPIKSCSPSKAQGLAWGKVKNGELQESPTWSVLFKKGVAVNIDTDVKSVKLSGVGTGSTYAQVQKAFPKGKEYCIPMGIPPAGNPNYSEDWDEVSQDVYMTFPSDLTSCPVPKASVVRDINVGAVDRSGQGSGTW